MIKKIVRKSLAYFGYELVFKMKVRKNEVSYDNKIPTALKNDPLNSENHLALAKHFYDTGQYFPAWASLQTANSLGLDTEKYNREREKFHSKIPNLDILPHNQYFRYRTLANEIEGISKEYSRPLSILDVGGGFGNLSSFIPENEYCLVEPMINAIDGLTLPFEHESYDLVVSCHVLEHIPAQDRDKFLDQLISKARKGVVLLNPIYVEGTHHIERMEMIVDITKASWAKEHLDCTLPTVEYIEEYASKRNLQYTYKPNGTTTTSLAMVFFDSLRKFMKRSDYEKVNQFYNQNYSEILDSEKYPNAGLFILMKPSNRGND